MNNIPNKFWSSVIGAIGILTIFLAIVAIKEIKSIFYVGKNPNMTNMITVSGEGSAVAMPDIASFSFSVTETAKTVDEAQSMATKKINEALKVVREAGVADKDIETQSYNINPHYEYQTGACTAYSCPSKSVLTGYDVSQSISVKVRKLADAGKLFSSIGSVGVTNINGLTFSVDNPDKVKEEARSKAIKQAQEKAETLARQLGVSLVRVTSFYENDNSYPRPMYGMGGAMEVSATKVMDAPEIPVGERKISSNVSVTYEIR